jgi:hypothetical protein
MNDEKWGDLKIKLNETFSDVKETKDKEAREDDVGHKIESTIETLEFTSPMGELKVVRTSRPKILDKKSHFHKGAGAAKVEYILSEDEMHHEIKIFKKDDTGEWQLMELPAEKLSF